MIVCVFLCGMSNRLLHLYFCILFFLFVVWSPALMGIAPSGRLPLWQINTLSRLVVKLDGIMHTASQETVFSTTTTDVVTDALDR